MRISRIIVTLVALLFAVLGIAFWVMPEPMAGLFHLEATGAGGLSSLRADLGGLFMAMALFLLAGAMARRRAPLMAGTVILVAILAGRVIGWLYDGWSADALPPLVVEAVALVAVLACALQIRAVEERERRAVRPMIAAVAFLVVVCVGTYVALRNPDVVQWIFGRAAARLTARSDTALLADDAMRVLICGSSAPLPSARRAKASVAVCAGGKFYVVDAGPESVENLLLSNIPLAQIGGVFITHFHSDHIGDLGELNLQTWAGGRPAPLAVYGGPGVEQVVDGFNLAYRQDQGYRTAHHTARVMPPDTWPMIAHPVELDGPPTAEKSRTALVLQDGDLRITAIEVDHPPIVPAYAYRFDYKGRSVVITGDYKFHPPLIKASDNADVLVSEAIARPMVRSLEKGALAAGRDRTAAIMHDIQDYHISPEEAAQIANQAHVKLLVFYHLLPAPDNFLARRGFAQGIDKVREGGWVMADDRSLYTLPIGSSEVLIGRVDN